MLRRELRGTRSFAQLPGRTPARTVSTCGACSSRKPGLPPLRRSIMACISSARACESALIGADGAGARAVASRGSCTCASPKHGVRSKCCHHGLLHLVRARTLCHHPAPQLLSVKSDVSTGQCWRRSLPREQTERAGRRTRSSAAASAAAAPVTARCAAGCESSVDELLWSCCATQRRGQPRRASALPTKCARHLLRGQDGRGLAEKRAVDILPSPRTIIILARKMRRWRRQAPIHPSHHRPWLLDRLKFGVSRPR